ncbi:hypothetical protein [Aliivibrio fischeri]|uniref:hypothetical protein n=1 Tax=Aliivibrio fischeri TaxID=668 RepID=UPI0012D9B0E5|nr:hypothetical protein [Aliivibrio fischeri]MUJ20448.1 hypothetical protein [Aliivibrio fischeri]
MITISPDHIASLKQQAYQIRDTLINLDLIYESDTSKAQWLSMFARSINSAFVNWNDLISKTKRQHKLCKNKNVITSDSIRIISKRMREELFLNEIDLQILMLIFKNSASETEALTFKEYQKTVFTKSDHIILELGPKTIFQRDFLIWFFVFKNMKYERLVVDYALNMKERRAGKTKLEIQAKSLNVYPKSNIKISSIVDELISLQYLELRNGLVSITENALQWCRDVQTDSQSKEWESWFNEWKRLITAIEYRQLPESWDVAISDFYNSVSPEQSASRYLWPQNYFRSDSIIREHINTRYPEDAPIHRYPKNRYFMLSPELMLTPNFNRLQADDIQFEITEKPNWLVLPKKLHVKKSAKTKYLFALYDENLKGWISKIPDNVVKFNINLKWSSKSGKFKCIKHSFTYILQVDHSEARNWLFSTFVDEYQVSTNKASWSFNSLYPICKSQTMSQEELIKQPRVDGGIYYIELNEKDAIIKEERTLVATNSLMYLPVSN